MASKRARRPAEKPVLIVNVQRGQVEFRRGGEVATFRRDDVEGPAEILRSHAGAVAFGSSTAFPQEDGAPKGWRFGPHWMNIERAALRQRSGR